MISTEDHMKSDQLQLIGYTDTDYTGCIDNMKSTLGYIFLIAGRCWIYSRSYIVIIRAMGLYCNSAKSSAKLKHIDIKFFVIMDKVRNRIVSIDSDSIILNITDPLTKKLLPKVFLDHITHMGMASHDDILV